MVVANNGQVYFASGKTEQNRLGPPEVQINLMKQKLLLRVYVVVEWGGTVE